MRTIETNQLENVNNSENTPKSNWSETLSQFQFLEIFLWYLCDIFSVIFVIQLWYFCDILHKKDSYYWKDPTHRQTWCRFLFSSVTDNFGEIYLLLIFYFFLKSKKKIIC